MKVSILMIAYQSVRWIKEAVDSVKAQSYANWELIISDDGSTDGTWELATMLAKRSRRIKVVRNKERLGIPKNRAQAYALCSGDLICHLDNDDTLEPWALQVMVDEFFRQPEVGLMYSDMRQMGANGEHQIYHAEKSPTFENLAKLGWRHLGMYRRSAMEQVAGYNTELVSACEDGDLFMQIAEKFPLAHVPRVLYNYRAHDNNSSQKNAKCNDCNKRPVCNYIRVWGKSAGYDHLTFTPLPKPEAHAEP